MHDQNVPNPNRPGETELKETKCLQASSTYQLQGVLCVLLVPSDGRRRKKVLGNHFGDVWRARCGCGRDSLGRRLLLRGRRLGGLGRGRGQRGHVGREGGYGGGDEGGVDHGGGLKGK